MFPTTEDPEAENDVDNAPALVMLSGGTSTVVSLGRFYEGDIVTVARRECVLEEYREMGDVSVVGCVGSLIVATRGVAGPGRSS